MRRAEDFFILDIHHHVGALGGLVALRGEWIKTDPVALQADVDSRISFMDSHGMDCAMLMPGNGYPIANGLEDTKRVNDYVRRYADLAPGRFPAAVGTISPLEGTGALHEIDRCIDVLGMKGMVWHHRFQGTALDHAMMGPFLDRLRDHDVPAFIHIIADSKLESPWRLEKLADKHPDVTFVALDGFSSPDHIQWMPYIASRHPNIVFDTGAMLSVGHMMESFIAEVGAERMILGTDFYSEPRLFSRPFPIDELLASDLDDTIVASILGGRALELLRLPADTVAKSRSGRG